MYQHIWYNKENEQLEVVFEGGLPSDWVLDSDIENIMLTCWCEHCLECAVPLCYNNCENWVERMDGKCQKSYYGSKITQYVGMVGAQLKLRKWGKIESWLNENGVSPSRYKAEYSRNYKEEYFCRFVSDLIHRINPSMKICGAQNYYRDKRLRARHTVKAFNTFLVQYYSPSDIEYNVMIELYTPTETFYRNSFRVKKGFNQALIDVNNIDLRLNQNTRARIYPENNICEDIVLFKSDFVNLKKQRLSDQLLPAKKVKCVAWDLDNTIWQGVLIESDPNTLELRDGIKDTMMELDNRGIIQVVVSKNDLSEVEPQLKRLGIYDLFVYVIANWNSKSENLKKAAKLINININTFALIDDSNYERGEVKENIPQIRVFDEKEYRNILHYPEFDVPVTEDGRNRRLMYQTEIKRKSIEENFEGTNIDFLKSCQLTVNIKTIDEDSFKRSYELVQRTNQLNLSGIKYSESDFRKVCFEGQNDCFVASCGDRYGDYGQVGFFSVCKHHNKIIIKEYAMSCRVASKWLEPALMKWLLDKYDAETLVFEGVDSKKNGLLIRTLQSFGLKNMSQDPNTLYLSIDSKNMNWDQVVTINFK